uniref:Uncharacterized protein n=1 Tax=Anguilla anguilla TaxID=7936 RepID=A0A0E9SP70_ANGAN
MFVWSRPTQERTQINFSGMRWTELQNCSGP